MSARTLLRSWASQGHLLYRHRRHVAPLALGTLRRPVADGPKFNRWHSHSHGLSPEENEKERAQLSTQDVKAADRITWIGVWLNVALSGLKGVSGVAFHSSGLVADAAHSTSDLISDFVTLMSLKYCAKPPDKLQPYGYGKYETMGALSVSLLLVGGSLGIITHSLDTLWILLEHVEPQNIVKSHELVTHPAALAIATVSVLAKEALYRATIHIGQRIHSSVLIANAWHHRSDAVTSIVAMGGIGMSLAGFPIFDPLAGIAVGGIILNMGAGIGWNAMKELCDAKLSDPIVESLEKAIDDVIRQSKGEILSVQRVRSRKVGRSIHVDLIMVVANGSTVLSALEWKNKVKIAIQDKIPRVKDVLVEITMSEHDSAKDHTLSS